MKDSFVITHNDLDGVSSLLIKKWLEPDSTFFYKTASNIQIENVLIDTIKNYHNPKNIIVMDLSLKESFLNFDFNFVSFIDHHKRSEKWINSFKKANIIHKNFTSNTKLLYFLGKEKNMHQYVTDKQKQFIVFVDDYDSGAEKYIESYNLNILYWNKYKNEPYHFLKDFKNGFREFTKSENKLIQEVKIEAVRIADKTPIYQGNLIFNNRKIKTISTFGEKPNMVVIDLLLKKYNPELFMYLNLKTKKVILRQTNSNNMFDLPEFARHYCNGDGNIYSAGGEMTDLLLELTKNLN
jgi:hypothetical protein